MPEAESDAIPIITGRAWAFGPGVTAQLILPAARSGSNEPARFLLTAIDPGFPSRLNRGDIIVGGGEFGAGASDDSSVRALKEAGVSALVAASFDPVFARFAFARRLIAVEVNESLAIHTGARLRIDLEAARVVNLSSGDRYPIRNVSDRYLNRFRSRDD